MGILIRGYVFSIILKWMPSFLVFPFIYSLSYISQNLLVKIPLIGFDKRPFGSIWYWNF